MLVKLFNSQTKTITFAAVLLGISAIISCLLGLIRDRLLAGKFGAGEELDIYFAAFRIPDFVYGILIMGGVAAVFLPVFSEYFRKGEEDKSSSSPTELPKEAKVRKRVKSSFDFAATRVVNELTFISTLRSASPCSGS